MGFSIPSSSSSSPSPPVTRMSSPVRFDSTPPPTLEAAHEAVAPASAPEAVRGLVPTTTPSYAVPGKSFDFLHFMHETGCRNAMSVEFDDSVRRAVVSSAPTTIKDVEFAVRGFLIGKDCSATCGLDKDSTTGLLVRFNSDRGLEYTPTPPTLLSPPTDSQVAIPESSLPPPKDTTAISTVGTSSWPPSPPPPRPSGSSFSTTPQSLGKALNAQPRFSLRSSASSSIPSFQKDMSSGERAMYGSKFDLDQSSDGDYQPPAKTKGGNSRRCARSESPTKRQPANLTPATALAPMLKVVDTDNRRKKHIQPAFPEVSLDEHRRRLAPPALVVSSSRTPPPPPPHACPLLT